MAASNQGSFFHRLPDGSEIREAEKLRKLIASQIKDGESISLTITLEGGAQTVTVTLTPALASSLLSLLRMVSSGRRFRITPVETELTTQQAADLLNVSRPYMIKLLDEEKIPFARTGRHRRIKAKDLFAYKEERDATRSEALRNLAEIDVAKNLI
ncbi:helix-turn-helix domain-containing protein [Roseibium sp. SCP14]|uniref:helix-turn-helix domain-containing protein n=1 Tax=Roseibium sp. SCP14 TaxID=3141375 RepID=UPI0033390BEF